MDDKTEQEQPKAKARTGKGTSRKGTSGATAPKAKTRSASARRTTAEEAKPPRKRPARRTADVEGDTAAKPVPARKGKAAAAALETKPIAKKAAAPAEPKPPRQTQEDRLPELPPAPAELHPIGFLGEGPDGDVTIHPVPPHLPSSHPHDEGLEFGLSPVDLDPDVRVREEAGLGWFIRILALSSVLLVLFNSFAIDKWAREQPVTKLNSQVLIAAHQLHAEMKSFHLDAPLEGLRSAWHGIRDARWPGSAANREKAADHSALK